MPVLSPVAPVAPVVPAPVLSPEACNQLWAFASSLPWESKQRQALLEVLVSVGFLPF